MPNIYPSNGLGQFAALRRQKWLVVALLVSNLALGALSVYLLRSEDTAYSRLIDTSMPSMNDILESRRITGVVYRSMIDALVADNAADTATALKECGDALRQSKNLRDKMLAGALLTARPDLTRNVREAGAAFDSEVEGLMAQVRPEDTARAERARIYRLGVVASRYGAATKQLSDWVESKTEGISDEYTAAMRSRSAVVEGLAGWPVVIAALVTAITLAGVLVMLLLCRQADTIE